MYDPNILISADGIEYIESVGNDECVESDNQSSDRDAVDDSVTPSFKVLLDVSLTDLDAELSQCMNTFTILKQRYAMLASNAYTHMRETEINHAIDGCALMKNDIQQIRGCPCVFSQTMGHEPLHELQEMENRVSRVESVIGIRNDGTCVDNIPMIISSIIRSILSQNQEAKEFDESLANNSDLIHIIAAVETRMAGISRILQMKSLNDGVDASAPAKFIAHLNSKLNMSIETINEIENQLRLLNQSNRGTNRNSSS